jgi:hypothetical protein
MKNYHKIGLLTRLVLIGWFSISMVFQAQAGPLRSKEIRLVEDHSAILADWLKKGIQEVVLVHVDAHSDLGVLPPLKARQIKQLARARDITGLRRGDRPGHAGLYHCGNFLQAALDLHMFKSIWWVVPFDWFGEQAPGRDMLEHLTAEGWSAQGLASLKYEAGCFRGTEFGVDFHICNLFSLPADPGPLALSLDTDFIPAYAGLNKQSGFSAAGELAQALLQKGYRTLDISIAYSVNGDYTPALKRWLGAALQDLLRTNGRPRQQPLWEALQKADTLAETASPRDLIAFLDSLPDALRDNSYCRQYRADAFYLENDIAGAFVNAGQACRLDKDCCAILSRIGYSLAIESRTEEAERFIREIAKRNPDYQDWQADLETALAWNEKGEQGKALYYLEKLSRQYRSYSAEFLIGGIYLKLNRLKTARARFDRALAYLQAASFNEIMRPEIAAAVSQAATFYDRLGLKAKSKAIRTSLQFEKIFSTDNRR